MNILMMMMSMNFFMASLEPLSIVSVYDDCGSDSWEGNGGEKKELQKQLIMPLSPNDDQQIAEISKSSFVIPETGPMEEIKQNMISNENSLQQPPVLQKNYIGNSRSSVQLRLFSFLGIQNEDLTPSQSFLLDHQEVVHEFHDPVACYMELNWGHYSCLFGFIKAYFYSSKYGWLVHLFFHSSTIYVLMNGSRFQFVNQLIEWFFWKFVII
jgi:hypothetical protein